MRRSLIWAALLPCALGADEVHLETGGRLNGVVVEWTDTQVVMDVGPGRVVLPRDAIKRVVPKADPLSGYVDRAALLGPDDLDGWLELGLWAHDRGMYTQAGQALERVIALDPGNALAHDRLGHVRHAGRWVTPDERYRALGYVRFQGRWVTGAEHSALLRERRDREASRLAQQREARRAREVAQRTPTAQPTNSTGIPLWYTWGGSGYGNHGYRSSRHHRATPHRATSRSSRPSRSVTPPSRPPARPASHRSVRSSSARVGKR